MEASVDSSPSGETSQIAALPRQTLSDNIYEKIRQAIVLGELEVGSELSQVDFAQRFGVSRIPVREALRQLQAEQLLTASAFKRYVVTGLTHEEIIELTEIRECLELFALERTMDSVKAGQVDPAIFEELAGRLQVDSGIEEWLDADIEFHRALSMGAPQAARMAEDTRVRVHRYLRVAVAGRDRRQAVMREHRAILLAVKKGDTAAARAALSKHVGGTRKVLAEYLRTQSSKNDS
jgi:DNA-binding GntR family transcriptional regulator